MNALTEMKVTAAPGPYDITGSAYITANGIGHVYIVDKNRRKIAAVWGSSQEKLATADLLAAAPDLLGALQMLSVRMIEGKEETLLLFAGRIGVARVDAASEEGVTLLKFARAQEAALAKATGADDRE